MADNVSVIMDKWGVIDEGYYCPTVEEMKNAKNAIAKEIFGEDFDTDDLTPEGMMFRVNTAAENKLLKIGESIYYSIFPHTAKGVSLDRVCEFANLKRDSAGYADHQLKVYGTQGYIVEAGTEFKNADGVEFYAVANATIENLDEEKAEYYAEVVVRCKESGLVGNINDINSTVEVFDEIKSVAYDKVIAYGTTAEADPELREKFDKTVQGLGANTTAAIIANVLRVSGANNCIILDNNKTEDLVVSPDLTVEAGTYAVIVHSDSTSNQTEIAEAIMAKQPLGIPQSGVEELTVADNSNTSHLVKFTYVAPKNVDVVVSCNIDSDFGSDGIKNIKDKITSYVNGLGIGEEVVYTALYHGIYGVTGVKKVTAMTINGGTADVSISKIEIAKIGNISVTVTEG